ncbi:MAG: hypothetical protein LQ342_000472 [Letrouitia transgressa]|nr:MAG: hypothetical protein LQ342_000472 [Letrouitia transgressa]
MSKTSSSGSQNLSGVTVFCAGQTSANVPSIKTRQGPPKNPAKNRQMASEAKLLESPAPRMKRAKSGKLTKYTGERPNRSLRCGVMIGAKKTPKRNRESGNMATVMDTSNRIITPWMPTVVEVRPKALPLCRLGQVKTESGAGLKRSTYTAKVNAAETEEAYIFLAIGQFCGLSGSVGDIE